MAQTLPDGTGMLFSIDYRFEQGRPDRYTQYVWVILPQKAQPLRQQVQLNDSGTLQAAARKMVPEIGPFRCHLEALARGASQPTVISEEVPMR